MASGGTSFEENKSDSSPSSSHLFLVTKTQNIVSSESSLLSTEQSLGRVSFTFLLQKFADFVFLLMRFAGHVQPTAEFGDVTEITIARSGTRFTRHRKTVEDGFRIRADRWSRCIIVIEITTNIPREYTPRLSNGAVHGPVCVLFDQCGFLHFRHRSERGMMLFECMIVRLIG